MNCTANKKKLSTFKTDNERETSSFVKHKNASAIACLCFKNDDSLVIIGDINNIAWNNR